MIEIAFAENPALIVVLFADQSKATEKSKKQKKKKREKNRKSGGVFRSTPVFTQLCPAPAAIFRSWPTNREPKKGCWGDWFLYDRLYHFCSLPVRS